MNNSELINRINDALKLDINNCHETLVKLDNKNKTLEANFVINLPAEYKNSSDDFFESIQGLKNFKEKYEAIKLAKFSIKSSLQSEKRDISEPADDTKSVETSLNESILKKILLERLIGYSNCLIKLDNYR